MLWYSININDNLITIENLASPDNISVKLYLKESCTSENDLDIKSILLVQPGETTTINIPLSDGLYGLHLERKGAFSGELKEESEITFPYFESLLKSMIRSTENFLCGCSCKDCDDCNSSEKEALNTLVKALSYYTIMYKYYNRFYDAVFKCLQCSIIDVTNCVIMNEKILGKTESKELFNKMISALYLGAYFAQWYSAEDKDSIDSKFRYNKIIKCIKNNDTNTTCITNNIENNMGLFSIQFGAYVNQPPSSVGNYNAGTVANQAVLTITPAMLTTLTTPAYADPENDAPQAVRIDTLATNGAVLTYNNNPVTVGQIVTIADMAANMLKISGPNQTTLASSTFNFSVRDTGSMQFTS